MLERAEFLKLQESHGPFDLNGAADPSGFNAHLTPYCSKAAGSSFLGTDVGGEKFYCNPPFRQAKRFLEHCYKMKEKDSSCVRALLSTGRPSGGRSSRTWNLEL